MSFIDKLNFSIIEQRIKKTYSIRFKKYGATPKGVFWKNTFTQDLRLEMIINIVLSFKNLKNAIFCDVGCGYGRLFQKLQSHHLILKKFHYYGIDINNDFINHCITNLSGKNVFFEKSASLDKVTDFTIMSGTYNLCTMDNISIWEKYLSSNLKSSWVNTKRAMIFNLLHKKEKKILNGLYYTEENWIKTFCEKNFGQTKIIKTNLLPDDILILVKR